jgi:ABC-type transporter Mla subunit MlaD
MTESSPDRLDRIEATLDRVSQQLDNQVVVNAELRQTAVQLTSSVDTLMQGMTTLVGITNNLTQVVVSNQEEILSIRTDMREMQSEVRGLQTENRRILDRLEQL